MPHIRELEEWYREFEKRDWSKEPGYDAMGKPNYTTFDIPAILNARPLGKSGMDDIAEMLTRFRRADRSLIAGGWNLEQTIAVFKNWNTPSDNPITIGDRLMALNRLWDAFSLVGIKAVFHFNDDEIVELHNLIRWTAKV